MGLREYSLVEQEKVFYSADYADLFPKSKKNQRAPTCADDGLFSKAPGQGLLFFVVSQWLSASIPVVF